MSNTVKMYKVWILLLCLSATVLSAPTDDPLEKAKQLVEDIKEKGQAILDKYVSDDVKEKFKEAQKKALEAAKKVAEDIKDIQNSNNAQEALKKASQKVEEVAKKVHESFWKFLGRTSHLTN